MGRRRCAVAMAAVVAVAAALAPGATLLRAIRGLAPNVFAPFPKDVWLRTPVERELVYGCLLWPRPRIGPRPFPGGGARPGMPVLVLNGELDQATPMADAQHVADVFPNATLVTVPNTGHVTALYDFQGCSAGSPATS